MQLIWINQQFFILKKFPIYLCADYYATANLLFWNFHQRILSIIIIQCNTDEGLTLNKNICIMLQGSPPWGFSLNFRVMLISRGAEYYVTYRDSLCMYKYICIIRLIFYVGHIIGIFHLANTIEKDHK